MPFRKVQDAGSEDETEGHMPVKRGLEDAGDEEDDTEGHLRLTDEQLASGLSPSELRDKERPNRLRKPGS